MSFPALTLTWLNVALVILTGLIFGLILLSVIATLIYLFVHEEDRD